jgi:hypothetical protein
MSLPTNFPACQFFPVQISMNAAKQNTAALVTANTALTMKDRSIVNVGLDGFDWVTMRRPRATVC